MLWRKMFWLIKCDFFHLFHTERSWHAYWFSVVIVPGNIVDFWNSDFLKKNSDFLKKSQFDLPSAWISFLYLLLCMNFFSWHFPLHEFFFCFFPTPHITFLMVRPLNTSAAHWDKNRYLCEFVPKKKCTIHYWASRWFLLFYSPKPRSQAWI